MDRSHFTLRRANYGEGGDRKKSILIFQIMRKGDLKKDFIRTGIEILTFPALNHITQMGGWREWERGRR